MIDINDKHLLMHVCCAPCSGAILTNLQKEGFDVSATWFNPNIHPIEEWQNRLASVVTMTQELNIPLYQSAEFQQELWLKMEKERCNYCYITRMEATAALAAREGFQAFTTSLLISPYQNHEAICNAAEAAAEKYGVLFFYRDFRPFYREGRNLARAKGWYMQKYCGCIHSYYESDHPKKPKWESLQATL